LLKPTFARQVLDVDEHGGAPLIGVDGVAVLTHGAASARAIENGIRVAASFVESGLTQAVSAAIARHAPLWAAEAAQASGAG
jgi:glycerol-3-phosphate acyltransferase PlsX